MACSRVEYMHVGKLAFEYLLLPCNVLDAHMQSAVLLPNGTEDRPMLLLQQRLHYERTDTQ